MAPDAARARLSVDPAAPRQASFTGNDTTARISLRGPSAFRGGLVGPF
jgi:hypothetical protein